MSDSKRWLKDHFSDAYVKRAQKAGYPSRAAYKLLEIQAKDRLFRPGMQVVDLGAAPGGWSMVAAELVGPAGAVLAVDCLPMDPLSGVFFIQGDFNDQAVLDKLLAKVAESGSKAQVDLVMSDMAPNLSGQKSIDQPASLHLVELAWDCAQQVLAPGGSFLAKIFQGAGVDLLIRDMRTHFKAFKIRKPEASRPRSREIYILGKHFLGNHFDS